MEKLKERWGVKNNFQLVVIFIVFAITGSTSVFIRQPIMHHLHISKETLSPYAYYPISILLIFICYQIMLVFNGFIFGQFEFFWNFEKKMLKRFGIHLK